jgi:hypothetical protein
LVGKEKPKEEKEDLPFGKDKFDVHGILQMIKRSPYKSLTRLLQEGLEINRVDPDLDLTLLGHSASSGNYTMTKFLVEKGADITWTNGNGENAMLLA